MATPDRVAQEIRLRRFRAASLTSIMFAGLVWLADHFGVMHPGSARIAILLIFLSIAGFYLLLRSGWNKYFKDPSLTLAMVLASSSVNTYVVFSLTAGRSVFYLVYLVSMLFGVFRLRQRELLAIAGYIVTANAILLWHLEANSAPGVDMGIARLEIIVLACVLVWFAFMGGYISTMLDRIGLAEFDELTGAYTRRRILEILKHEKLRADRSGGPLSVMFLDIDRLKRINDSLGHQGGDRHLRRVALAVQKEMRGIDYMGRYGGDEFLTVLSETNMRGALECAERIQRRLQHLESGVDDPAATVSIGIAEYIPGEALTQTVGRADVALYQAKASGRDRIECARSDVAGAVPG